MEIGPDEEMPVAKETAKLLEVVEGAENVERMDALLSLAVTGGDYEWIESRRLRNVFYDGNHGRKKKSGL